MSVFTVCEMMSEYRMDRQIKVLDRIRGGMIGGIVGYSSINEKWKQNLELADVILEMADDLGSGCPISGYSDKQDLVWESKYIYMRRAEK